MAAHMIAWRVITSRQLTHVEAAELLRVTAEAIQNEAQEIH